MTDFLNPFLGSQAIADGLVGRGELSGPRFVRVFPDVYVSAEARPTIRLRSEAARLLLGRERRSVRIFVADLLGADCASPRGR
jgi:hypothetical protein